MTLPVPLPDLRFESAARARGAPLVAGVDEVGRGPLAGPVVAAAVMLDPALTQAELARALPGLNDSKKLSAARRAGLAERLQGLAVIGIGTASVEEIDRINILQASFLAMRRAIEALPQRPDHLLIDGNKAPEGLPCPAETLVGGDGRSASIAAASIVAKLRRDAGMADLAQQHPGYGWERNAGYGTRQHMAALQDLGVTPHHRRSFKPIHNILYQAVSASA